MTVFEAYKALEKIINHSGKGDTELEVYDELADLYRPVASVDYDSERETVQVEVA